MRGELEANWLVGSQPPGEMALAPPASASRQPPRTLGPASPAPPPAPSPASAPGARLPRAALPDGVSFRVYMCDSYPFSRCKVFAGFFQASPTQAMPGGADALAPLFFGVVSIRGRSRVPLNSSSHRRRVQQTPDKQLAR